MNVKEIIVQSATEQEAINAVIKAQGAISSEQIHDICNHFEITKALMALDQIELNNLLTHGEPNELGLVRVKGDKVINIQVIETPIHVQLNAQRSFIGIVAIAGEEFDYEIS